MAEEIYDSVQNVFSVSGIIVDIYARVSTSIQEEDGTSLEMQVENCLALVKAKGYTVAKIHREVYTGALYRERELLSEMRRRYRNGTIQGVIFNAFDRLSRNQVHLGVLIDEMEHYNVIIECVKEKFDTTPAGVFMRNALAFVAQVEREKFLERSEDGRKKRAIDGKMLGWHSPRYGYAWNEDRTAYVINEQEAIIVRRIYAMALQRVSIHSIASTLTEEGVPTRGNLGTRKFKGIWLHSTVHRILSSPCYIGVAVVYRTRQEKINGKRHTTYRSDEEVITLPDGVIPPITDKETFEVVQEQLQRNKRRSARNNQQPEDALLRCGLVICGYCGRNGVVTRKAINKIDYRCKSSADRERGVCEGFTIGARILDKAAWEHAVEIIRDAKIVEQKLQGKRRQNPTHGEYEPIDRRLKEIKKEVQNLIVMGQYAQNDDTVRTLGERFAQLEREKLGLLQEQEKLQMVEKMYEEELLALLTFEQRCGMYRQKLEDAHASFTYTEKREVLEYFGIKAFVWREKHTPRFKIISSASDTATELS